jgi:hypothetical protein
MTEPPVERPFLPDVLIQVLGSHRVDYVLIGALAARMAGFPRLTGDADLTPAPDKANLKRLAAALRELNAKVWTQELPSGLPFDCSAPMLAMAKVWSLITDAGRVDLLFKPAGSAGYAGLVKDAVEYKPWGTTLRAASLPALLRMKEAANRPKDQDDAVVIRAMIARDRERTNATRRPR